MGRYPAPTILAREHLTIFVKRMGTGSSDALVLPDLLIIEKKNVVKVTMFLKQLFEKLTQGLASGGAPDILE